MIDFINYYYNLYPLNIYEYDDRYIFDFNDEKYYFILYDREIDELNSIIELNKEMITNGSLVHEIVFNRFNKSLTLYNNKNYILLRVFINDTKKVDINDIMFMLNEVKIEFDKNNILNRINWSNLWEFKIDYFEYQITHILKKYQILYNTIDYYIGLGENAIQYFKGIVPIYNGNVEIGVCHKRINENSTLFDLYNPLNLIIDYKVRDLSEYIKSIFFNTDNINIIINKVTTKYYFDKFNASLLVSRLLFPSYYFDMFEDIVYKSVNEGSVKNITKKSSMYENLIGYLIKKFNIQSIGWIDINQH